MAQTDLSSLLAIGMTISVGIANFIFEDFLFYDQFVVSSSSLIWLAFFWVMSKCTFTIVSIGLRKGQLTFSHRLCKLFACHVRRVSSWVRYLTVSTLRLNSRDYVRDRSTNSNQDHALNLSSIRIEPPSDTYGSKPRQAGVSVTVHRSTTLNFARNKSGHDVDPDFEVPNSVRSLRLLATPRSILILPAGCNYLPISGPSSNVEVECVGS